VRRRTSLRLSRVAEDDPEEERAGDGEGEDDGEGEAGGEGEGDFV